MDRPTRRRAFGIALANARRDQGLTQEQLADQIDADQKTVSKWERGEIEPSPDMADAAEQALDVAAGTLTIHLGYLPPRAAGESRRPSVTEALLADPLLDDEARSVLLGSYRVLTRRDRR